MRKGTLSKYVATPMLMTLIIRLESSEEIELPLDDDLFAPMFGDHERVSYIPSDIGDPYAERNVRPDKVTCEIENGKITRTVIETDGVAIEE